MHTILHYCTRCCTMLRTFVVHYCTTFVVQWTLLDYANCMNGGKIPVQGPRYYSCDTYMLIYVVPKVLDSIWDASFPQKSLVT